MGGLLIMTNEELEYLQDTHLNGVSNKENPIWIKAFAEAYPTISMDVDIFYIKVFCKLFVS